VPCIIKKSDSEYNWTDGEVSGWNCAEDMPGVRDTLMTLSRNLQVCEKLQKSDRLETFENTQNVTVLPNYI
jgi:hypothetical protein